MLSLEDFYKWIIGYMPMNCFTEQPLISKTRIDIEPEVSNPTYLLTPEMLQKSMIRIKRNQN